ncbi:sugar transferase, partial [Acinetobacter baumannii]
MKRFFDIFVAVAACLVLALPMLLVAILVKLTSRGPVLYWS